MMKKEKILELAKQGRPDLAAANAGIDGDLRLAGEMAKYPHSFGHFYSARELVTYAQHMVRWARRNDSAESLPLLKGGQP